MPILSNTPGGALVDGEPIACEVGLVGDLLCCDGKSGKGGTGDRGEVAFRAGDFLEAVLRIDFKEETEGRLLLTTDVTEDGREAARGFGDAGDTGLFGVPRILDGSFALVARTVIGIGGDLTDLTDTARLGVTGREFADGVVVAPLSNGLRVPDGSLAAFDLRELEDAGRTSPRLREPASWADNFDAVLDWRKRAALVMTGPRVRVSSTRPLGAF